MLIIILIMFQTTLATPSICNGIQFLRLTTKYIIMFGFVRLGMVVRNTYTCTYYETNLLNMYMYSTIYGRTESLRRKAWIKGTALYNYTMKCSISDKHGHTTCLIPNSHSIPVHPMVQVQVSIPVQVPPF